MDLRMLSIAVGLAVMNCATAVAASPFAHPGLPTVVLTIAEKAPAEGADVSADSGKPQDRVYLGNEPLESCMKRWDADTHMTKDAWRASCRRISEERAPYVKGQ